MEKENRIDFKLVKAMVSFEMLIVHYGIASLTRKGDEVRLKCPFHQGKTDNSLSIDLDENKFYCFGCKTGGNVLDFVGKKEKCSVKDAALKLFEWFELGKRSTEEELEREAVKTENEHSPLSIVSNIEAELDRLKSLLISR
jgi:DNA primase